MHIQVDEIWSFIYPKAKNVERAKNPPPEAGDAWTWTALDADSKLVITWYIGLREMRSAHALIWDLRGRVALRRPQITSDGLYMYPAGIEAAFGADVDHAELIKIYGPMGDAVSPDTR